eukprot:TRINITY_DN3987_c0_g1_i3.p1 TRINITY_DN3987_c0_g1~~TRINITY_DN3987_c0_g1_i3.p1  ORF type:complete len:483 (-),score=93.18 TRINITY_DN3987_c0_g1_i3:39-1487(-)
MRFFLFIVAILALASLSFTKEKLEPGLSLAFRTSFFRSLLDIVFPVLFQIMNTITLRASQTLIKNKILTLEIALDEFSIRNMSLDNKTSVEIQGDTMEVHVSGFNLNMTTRVSFNSKPQVLIGKGTGRHYAESLNGTVRFKLEPNEGRLPRVNLERMKFNVGDNQIYGGFEGTNDLFKVANAVSKLIVAVLKGTLDLSLFNKDEIQDILDYVIDMIPTTIRIEEQGIELNYASIGSPSMVSGVLPLRFNGTISCFDPKLCKPYNGPQPAKPRDHDLAATKNDLSVFVTEHLVDTASIAMFQRSLFHWDVNSTLFNGSFKINVDFLRVLIPNIGKYYANGEDEVTLSIELLQPPFVKFIPENFSFSTVASVKASVNKTFGLNSKDTDEIRGHAIEEAVTMKMGFGTTNGLSIANNILKGNIKDFVFNSTYVSGVIQPEDMKDFNGFLNVTLKLLIPQINSFLSKGIIIPVSYTHLTLPTSDLV